jgi:flagellar motor protein MotB
LAVNNMLPDKRKRAYRNDMLLASAMVMAGLALSELSLAELMARIPQQVAQATQPLQSSPPSAVQDKPPAESKPGGERPTTPAPEPARPDVEAQKVGATPALPPAPAEKTAAPIQEK